MHASERPPMIVTRCHANVHSIQVGKGFKVIKGGRCYVIIEIVYTNL